MTSNCQELSESDVKIVLVNNGTTPVFLSLLYGGIQIMYVDIFHVSGFTENDLTLQKGFHRHTRLLTVKIP